MAIKLEGIKDAEAWSSGVMLPVGWHTVTIESAEEGETRNNHPQIEMELQGEQGTIRDWLVVTPATMGKVASLLDAVKIDRDGIDQLDAKVLEGKKLSIYVGEEPDYKDQTKTRKRVQAYDAPGKQSAPSESKNGDSQADDDIPF